MPISALASVRRYESLGDDELTGLAQRGEREAFAGIMQRFNQRLFRIARSIVLDDFEAEDVLQEAYTHAFANFAKFRRESSLATWLTAITLNEARGRLRRMRRHTGLEALEPAQPESGRAIMFPPVYDSVTPEGEAGRAEARRLLERAVDALPEIFRVVFVMRELDEFSVAETAQTLGVRPETVKTRLHRARHLLRETLGQTLGSMKEAFPFLGTRCARITGSVLERLAPAYGWERIPSA